jgi:twinkle protein
LKVDAIKETFEDAAKRLNIKNFIVDNLMIVDYDATHQEKHNKQAKFVKAMKDFAKRYDVHVHIVAHPRKPRQTLITRDDVAGLFENINIVDNLIGIHRVTDKNREALGLEEFDDTENVAEIFKNRIYGMQDISIKLGFNEDAKRFAQRDINDFRKSYGWEDYQLEGD